MLGHTSSGGTVRVRKLAKERLVNAGTVVGLDEQLMQAPYQCTYTTASFVHLFFFDKTQVTRSTWILQHQRKGDDVNNTSVVFYQEHRG